ncbi:PSP1 C-terminal conserved region-domain-containing protein [Mrakia frigida]|uniref:PSP1 family protein n=1 Tax=Mrakia frigida TaxID=29902 RepID=UPI003FCC109A
MRGASPFNPLGSRLPPPQQQSPTSPFPAFYPQHPHPPQQQQQQHQRHPSAGSPSSPPQGPSLTELGKGLPLSAVPTTTPLYIVEFKAGRTDLFYCPDPTQLLTTGDLVIVEADRGKDLGKIVNDSITLDEVKRFQEQQAELAFLAQQVGLGGQGSGGGGGGAGGAGGGGGGAVGVVNSVTVRGLTKEIMPKRIYSKAMPLDAQLLLLKMQDEAKALALCQQKVKQKKLPMEVVDAEYQWDRRKLVFYFVASTRIDFRELVRELFRHFKTRICGSSSLLFSSSFSFFLSTSNPS